MRNRTVLLALFIAALLLWAGLILFMNRQPPNSLNQLIFLLGLGTAIALTAMPLAYVVNARLTAPLGGRGDMQRAVRQGGLLSLLGVILMTLRFIRLLTWPIAVILILVVVLVELLFHLRHR